MNLTKKPVYVFFGELAVDVTYNEKTGLIVDKNGGVSAANALYYISIFGKKTYAVGGVGAIGNKDNEGNTYYGIAINSLQDYSVNTDYIEPIYDKTTNIFYIPQPSTVGNEVEIKRASPFTGKSSIEWTNELHTEIPEELKDEKIILIVSNFEPATRVFVKKVKKQCPDSIISLDITNEKIFEKYSNEEILEYLKSINLLQCTQTTAEFLCKKLNIPSYFELFSQLNAEIFTLTKDKDGATFFYRTKGNIYMIDKKPEIVIDNIVDSTGAGDAFHAMLLLTYCKLKSKNKALDKKYFDIAFYIANALSRKVIQAEGARLKPYDILFYLMDELKALSTNDKDKLNAFKEILDMEK